MHGGWKPFHVFRWDQKELKGEKLILGSKLPPASYSAHPPPPVSAPYHVLHSNHFAGFCKEGVPPPNRDSWEGVAKDRNDLAQIWALAPSFLSHVTLDNFSFLGFFICKMIIGFSTEGCREDWIKQDKLCERLGTMSFLNNTLQKMRAGKGGRKGVDVMEQHGEFLPKVRPLT